MKILIACEFSGIVRDAFRAKGHDAWSCDFLECEKDNKYHIQTDVLNIINDGWDMMIAHPPCTYLCNSGVCWLHKDVYRWDKMISGARMFKNLLESEIPKKCIENPIMHKYAVEIIGRRQDQIIQPWQFGHSASKATGLWLENLPKLESTNILKKPESGKWDNQTKSGRCKLPPSEDRWKIRSRTFQGIADAMADQWG